MRCEKFLLLYKGADHGIAELESARKRLEELKGKSVDIQG